MELYSKRISSGGHCFGVKGITTLHVKRRFYVYDPRDNSGKLGRQDHVAAFDERHDIARWKVKRYFLVWNLNARRLSAISPSFDIKYYGN